MANFRPNVLKSILNNEGGYVNDPADNGGETWAGIARNSAPKWAGWLIVDAIKKNNPIATAQANKGSYKALNVYLFANLQLAELVAKTYERDYWDINSLDLINDQQLAANVCDCGVNCGTGTGAKMLQKAYNTVIRAGYTLLSIDGKIGKASIAAINADNAVKVYDEYNILRRAYYNDIVARRPSQAKFLKSWLSRIIPYKA